MNKKAIFILYSFIVSLIFIICELFYIQKSTPTNIEAKLTFTRLVGLPDLAIVNETYYLRHRTMSNVFNIYKDEATLREYAKTSFVIGDFK